MVLPRILIAEPDHFSEKAVRILRSVGEVVLEARSDERLVAAFQEFDVVWMRLAHRIDSATLGDRARCRVLAIPATGVDHVDLQACGERGIQVISLKGEVDFLKQVRATAELTIGLAIALMRRIPQAARSVQTGEWKRDLFEGTELYGKTAGIVGVGRLGEIVAGYFAAFGMKVAAYDPRPDFPGTVPRLESLEELLMTSDVVSLHPVLDRSTRNLIGKRELELMKPTAFLINTSRGGVIDEAALLRALRSGAIAGAALDVLDSEPGVPENDPLIEHARSDQNLLIVPHIGGKTSESMEKTEIFIARKVVEALS